MAEVGGPRAPYKFFRVRHRIDLDLGDHDEAGYVDYENIPRLIGIVVSSGLATLRELRTVYSLEDLYNLLEVYLVNAHNQRVARKPRK